jgi:hypothetical protein
MINWRTIVGLLLMTFGVRQLYNIIANPSAVNTGTNPAYAKIGCVVWMGVGVYLLVKGTMKKDNTKF